MHDTKKREHLWSDVDLINVNLIIGPHLCCVGNDCISASSFFVIVLIFDIPLSFCLG